MHDFRFVVYSLDPVKDSQYSVLCYTDSTIHCKSGKSPAGPVRTLCTGVVVPVGTRCLGRLYRSRRVDSPVAVRSVSGVPDHHITKYVFVKSQKTYGLCKIFYEKI